MPDLQPRYRFRGCIAPSAAAKRPVAAIRNATAGTGSGGDEPTSATIDIFDVIDSYGGWWGISAGEVAQALKQVGDVDMLYVRLNSPGGEAQEGVAIANLLRATKADVRVTVYGIAASAASAVAIAGDTVSMAPGSILMIHEAWNIALGDADKMRKEAAALDAVSDSYADLYALKAGGSREEWRAVMKGEKWYPATDAVEAKLADQVGIDAQLPPDLPAVEDAEGEQPVVVNVDVEINPDARAAARRFDLSMYRNTPAALAATQTPAEPPETQHTDTEEAVTMTETELKALRERLGLAEDADAAAVNAKLDELEEQATKPEPAPAAKVDTAAVVAALEADGKVVMSKAKADALEEQAKLGAQARAKQLLDERDEAIEAAMAAGKISRSQASRESWEREFARDPETAKADLASLPARFPVTGLQGRTGDDGSTGDAAFTDDEAAQLAALTGTTKEGLLA